MLTAKAWRNRVLVWMSENCDEKIEKAGLTMNVGFDRSNSTAADKCTTITLGDATGKISNTIMDSLSDSDNSPDDLSVDEVMSNLIADIVDLREEAKA